ncbi:MAG: hypothetical protein JSW10_04895 [Pseudomonadota bacterium]|nr:MAG: hypothetical protein JSW10_04895 [Pseudomonadota bacterium]
MRSRNKFCVIAAAALGFSMNVALAQGLDEAAPAGEVVEAGVAPDTAIAADAIHSELRLHVSGSEDVSDAVFGANVYIKYNETRDEVRTNSEGIAVLSKLPRGKVTIMVTAPGWETFADSYDLEERSHSIKVRLTRQVPPVSAAGAHAVGASATDGQD